MPEISESAELLSSAENPPQKMQPPKTLPNFLKFSR